MDMLRFASVGIGTRSEGIEGIFSIFPSLDPATDITMPFCPTLFIAFCLIDSLSIGMVDIDNDIFRRGPCSFLVNNSGYLHLRLIVPKFWKGIHGSQALVPILIDRLTAFAWTSHYP